MVRFSRARGAPHSVLAAVPVAAVAGSCRCGIGSLGCDFGGQCSCLPMACHSTQSLCHSCLATACHSFCHTCLPMACVSETLSLGLPAKCVIVRGQCPLPVHNLKCGFILVVDVGQSSCGGLMDSCTCGISLLAFGALVVVASALHHRRHVWVLVRPVAPLDLHAAHLGASPVGSLCQRLLSLGQAACAATARAFCL